MQVDRIHLVAVRVVLGRLQDHRRLLKAGIVQQATERFEPQASFADVLVPIHAAAERFLAVFQVAELEPPQADHAIELAERRFVFRLRRKRIARGERVAGVEADAKPPLVADLARTAARCSKR